MKIFFATNNQHKIKEVQELLPAHFSIITLAEAGIFEEIPEPFDTFEANAQSKALFVYEKTGLNCFAEDSGICVAVLNGAPGVFSARFAGTPCHDENNLQLLLSKLKNEENRHAYYNATIALIWEGETHYFSGQCHGQIALEKAGDKGFGYDPIFIPEGHQATFGVLPESIKAQISHRKKAIEKMLVFFQDKD